MSISGKQLEATAKLARIQLPQSELDSVASRISSILAMVDQMQAVDTSAVEPMAHPLDAVQQLRCDIVEEPADKEAARDALLAGAPSTEDGLFLVPKVIE